MVELLLLYYNGITQFAPGVIASFLWKRATAWGVGLGIAAGPCGCRAAGRAQHHAVGHQRRPAGAGGQRRRTHRGLAVAVLASREEIAMNSTPVLIVGAGPTGLVLALSLARRGVPFRLIDEASGPGEHSRAMAVQARTLEFYRQFGFADEMIKCGVIVRRAHMREAGADGQSHEVLCLEFGDLGAGISPYPFVFTFPQDDHERFLNAKLEATSNAVEWNTSLTGLQQTGDGIVATVTGPAGRANGHRRLHLRLRRRPLESAP